jgi:hypothetical protein
MLIQIIDLREWEKESFVNGDSSFIFRYIEDKDMADNKPKQFTSEITHLMDRDGNRVRQVTGVKIYLDDELDLSQFGYPGAYLKDYKTEGSTTERIWVISIAKDYTGQKPKCLALVKYRNSNATNY